MDELSAGLGTSLGVHGASMSGGQEQRLGIARVLADFPILVLDEPGEHLDTSTADAIVADLVELTDSRSDHDDDYAPLGGGGDDGRDHGARRGAGGRARHTCAASRAGRRLCPAVGSGEPSDEIGTAGVPERGS